MTDSKILRTDYKYDIDEVLLEWEKIKAKLQHSHWYQGTQTCLQYSSKCKQKFTDGYGVIDGATVISTDGCGNLNSTTTGRTEQDFNLLNPLYENTIFEQIINDVGACRARIMKIPKHTCYSIHSDRVGKPGRYHLPMITNPHALFMFYESEISSTTIHLPANGYVWWTDTTKEHTFINAGPERTHLVMCIIK